MTDKLITYRDESETKFRVCFIFPNFSRKSPYNVLMMSSWCSFLPTQTVKKCKMMSPNSKLCQIMNLLENQAGKAMGAVEHHLIT